MAEISDNLLSAFLDGNTTKEETELILDSIKHDKQLKDFFEVVNDVDKQVNKNSIEVLPMTAMAAAMGEDSNKCAMLCELYVLQKYGISYSRHDWELQARRQGWLTDTGMALFNIGRLLEQECFSICRTFHNTLATINSALSAGESAIVVVDTNELTCDINELNRENIKDEWIGTSPNHAVVIESIDFQNERIKFYDPAKQRVVDFSKALFLDAWEDSNNYLVTIKQRDLKNYKPHPIDISDVTLDDSLAELQEAIAENAHEIWADNRQKEGWTYGPNRNDKLKQTPDMIPYSDLPDSEKMYDRNMAMQTIKLVRKLGYDIVKREDSKLYQLLYNSINQTEVQFRCRSCGCLVFKHQVFCDHCGKKLDIEWNAT